MSRTLVLSPLLVAASSSGNPVTVEPTATPAPSPGAGGALGTGAGILVAVVLVGLLLWFRSRVDRG